MSHDLPPLLPCPFCGNEDAKVVEVLSRRQSAKCDADGPTTRTSPAEAIAAWNRRAASPDRQARAEEAKRALEDFGQTCRRYYEGNCDIDERDASYEAAHAAIDRLAAADGDAPPGWKLVPVEQTVGMVKADWKAAQPYRHGANHAQTAEEWNLFLEAGLRASYKALLAAAPQPENPR